jgi:uncharacterized protein YeaO (DUF488 family)
MAAAVRIKRIYEPSSPEDGARLLVDRVWPRGITKEAAALTMWIKEVAPSTALRKWFGHDPARWPEFHRRYLDELAANTPAVDRIRDYIEAGRTTLLYAAHDPAHNNAVALADYLRKQPGSRHVL